MVFAQISDLHLTADENLFDGAGPDTHAVACVSALNRLNPRPDFVIITGDIAESADAAVYQRTRQILGDLQVPYFVIPGNHDDRHLLYQTFRDSACPAGNASADPYLQYTFSHGGFRFVGLDTLEVNSAHGFLCQTRLSWLEAVLRENSVTPRILFLHHPPVATGHPVVDESRLQNGADLGRLLGRFPAETHLLCGHVHRSVSTIWNGAAVHICPSVYHQFSFDRWLDAELKLVPEPPAFRVYLQVDGTLVSHVVYV